MHDVLADKGTTIPRIYETNPYLLWKRCYYLYPIFYLGEYFLYYVAEILYRDIGT